MAKAKRVRSTPRKTAPKIQPTSKTDRDEQHAEAFRDLEGSMLDLICMAEIAESTVNGRQNELQIEMAHFAICKLCEMIRNLRTKYRSDLHAGKAVA